MKEIIINGKVKEDGGWYLETEDMKYSADLLAGTDEILTANNEEVLHYDEEIEIVIRLKNR